MRTAASAADATDSAAPCLASIHDTGSSNALGAVEGGSARAGDRDAQIIFYDHGTGEPADFLTLASRVDDVLATLFHSKASSARNPGERVDDLYEVCGQAVKLARWVDRKLMLGGLEERAAPGSIFLSGSMEQARTLLSRNLPLNLRIMLVQPGLSRAVLTVMRGNLFSAVDEFGVHSNQGSWRHIARLHRTGRVYPTFLLHQDSQTLSLSCEQTGVKLAWIRAKRGAGGGT
jgi:hypothetical protein